MSLFKGQEELDLTDGGIAKPLLYLSLPIVLTNIMQTAYNLADTFWLGQYSTDALAAVSFAFGPVFLLISLGMGLSVAGSVLVAQYTGAGQTEKAEYAASQTVVFSILGSILFGAIGYVIVGPLVEFLGAEPNVVPGATGYLQVVSLGLPFMFVFFVFNALMRGSGDTITPMVVMFGTVIINVVLDPFLINGWTVVSNAPLIGTVSFPELGVEGAAIATVFSRGVAMIVGLAIMESGRRGIQIHVSDMKPDLSYLRRIVDIGVPASVEGSGRALSINALLFVVGMFSTNVVAAFGIGTRIFSVVFLPALAVSRGVETMSGQNAGAGKYDRIEQANYVAAKGLFVVLTVLGIIAFLFPTPIVSLFSDDPAVIDIAVTFLRYVALSFGFIGIMRAFTGGFRGTGNTMVAAVIAVGTLAGIRLPIAYVASQFDLALPYAEYVTGAQGIWAAFFISNVVGAVIAWLWFRRGSWRGSDVRTTPQNTDDAGDVATVAGDD